MLYKIVAASSVFSLSPLKDTHVHTIDPSMDPAEIFQSRKNAPDPRFLYDICVLKNFNPFDFSVATNFVFAIRTAKIKGHPLPELPYLETKQSLFEVEDVKEKQSERTFYTLHILIETLVEHIFQLIDTIQPNKPENNTTLNQMTVAMQAINTIAGEFNHYMDREGFNEIRPKLAPASGAQSPIRFLDILLFGPLTLTREMTTVINNHLKLHPVHEKPALQAKLLEISDASMWQQTDPSIYSKQATEFATTTLPNFPTLSHSPTPLAGKLNEQEKELLAKFMLELMEFKYHHMTIIAYQIYGKEVGTGGTRLTPFLAESLLRNYEQYCTLLSAPSHK